MNEVATLDSAFDDMMAAVKSGDTAGLMKLSGQTEDDTPKQGLSRLNINYETETDDGITLKKGAYKVWYNGEFVYADSVMFQPLFRTFEWSIWDQDEGKFSCRSVQAPSINHNFPDTNGGNKCGRLTKSEEEQLGEDHPLTLASRLAVCNQVFYGKITMDGKNAEGNDVKIEDYPIVAYFKKSGFRPAREAIEALTKREVVMNEAILKMTTKRHKSGSVTYFTPEFTYVESKKLDDETIELMSMFSETIKASNANIMEQYKEAVKAKATAEEIDLEADFN